MALSTNPPAQLPKQTLLSHLEAGSTGVLHARAASGEVLSVYVMLGEILAAHAADDRDRLLRVLSNGGVIEVAGVEALRRSHREGATITEELFEVVPEDILQELLSERFRENVFQYLQAADTPQFEPMESVFVDNIQVGHDSRGLVEELERAAGRTARLREPPGLVLAPGAGTMKDPAHLRLAALCRPRLPIADLITRSPWESCRTLSLVADMLERGVLVAVAAREDTTDRPAARSPAGAKVVVAPGRPEGGRSIERRAEGGGRDAVAAALANAVSAAVAKVGRQREAGDAQNAPTIPPTSGQARSPLDAVSAPMARRGAPPLVNVPRPAEPVRPAAPASRPFLSGRPESARPTDPPRPAAPPPPAAAPVPPAPGRLPDPPRSGNPNTDLPAFDDDHPTEEVDDEMAAFQDYDHERVGGEFLTEQQHLDRVELLTAPAEPKPTPVAEPDPSPNITIEMEDAEHATRAELASAVALNFAGPKLAEEEAERKVGVVNDVLVELAAALDKVNGAGSGQSRVQLLVEGTPGAFSALFKNLEVGPSGAMPTEAVLKNLRKRPASEHRRLLNRCLADLIDRALSLASEELDDETLESLLERVAGYQQRLGM